MTISLAAQRQKQALRQADLVADASDRALTAWWGSLNAILQHGPRFGLPWTAALVRRHFQDLPTALAHGLRAGLTDLVRWGHASARADLLRTLPPVAARQVVRRRGLVQARPFTEDRSAADFLFSVAQPLRDYGPRLYAPAFGDLSDDESRSLLKSFILPPPSEDKVRRHVERLIQPFLAKPRADLVPPQQLADVVIQHYAAGKTQDQITELLLPHVNGVASSARRIARTWGTQVANATQLETSERLSDVIIGYTIRSAKKATSRPAHVRRDGTKYYRQPGPGQLGFESMPRPPLESDGTVAWNCLCWSEPIFNSVL